MLVALGCAVALLAVLGLYAVLANNSLLVGVGMFGLILATLALAALAAWSLLIDQNASLITAARRHLVTSLRAYDETNVTASATRDLDWLQTHLACCGLEAPADWKASANVNAALTASRVQLAKHELLLFGAGRLAYDVPDSCCVTYARRCRIADFSSHVVLAMLPK